MILQLPEGISTIVVSSKEAPFDAMVKGSLTRGVGLGAGVSSLNLVHEIVVVPPSRLTKVID